MIDKLRYQQFIGLKGVTLLTFIIVTLVAVVYIPNRYLFIALAFSSLALLVKRYSAEIKSSGILSKLRRVIGSVASKTKSKAKNLLSKYVLSRVRRISVILNILYLKHFKVDKRPCYLVIDGFGINALAEDDLSLIHI